MRWLTPNIDKLARRRDIGRLVDALDDARPTVRQEAARALGALHDEAAVAALAGLLSRDDPDVEVRSADAQAAAQALAQLGTESAFVVLQESRHSDHGRAIAARALCAFRGPDELVFDALLELVDSGPLSVRSDAIERIASFDGPKVLVAMDRALANHEPGVRAFAVADIERRIAATAADGPRPRRTEPFTMAWPSRERVTLASDPVPPDVQARCAAADGQWEWAARLGSASIEPLLWLLEEGAEGAADAAGDAAEVLARMGNRVADEGLVRVSLGSERRHQALAAAHAYCSAGRAMEPPVVGDIASLARSAPFSPVRKMAVQQLGALSHESVVGLLDEALADEAVSVRRAAVDAIEQRVGAPPVDPRRHIGPARMPRPSTRQGDGATHSVPDDVQARCAAADSQWSWAAALGAASIEPLLWLVDQDSDGERRRLAAATVGRIEDPRVAPMLIERLDQAAEAGRETVIEAVAVALGAVGDSRGIPSLRSVLLAGAASPASRAAAARALVDIGGPDSTEILLAALRHEDHDIVAATAQSLGAVTDQRVTEGLTAARERRQRWLAGLQERQRKLQDELLAAYMDDDSPGHSTYRLERDEMLAKADPDEAARASAERALDALDRALDRGRDEATSSHRAGDVEEARDDPWRSA